jgi:hypothetical protein
MRTPIKKILPSKKFTIITSVTLSIVAVIFLAFFFLSDKSSLVSKNKSKVSKLTVEEVVQMDSDGDAVADWEEALWGTDKNNKTTFGVSDFAYIEEKRRALRAEQEITLDEKNATETDKFAREFFTAYTALRASEQDNFTINNFSNALGQRIINPALIDEFREEDVKVSGEDTKVSRERYYQNMKNLYEEYSEEGIGDELQIISNNLISEGSEGKDGSFDELLIISEAYKDFAQRGIEMEVPKSLVKWHLKIVNGANNTGISVANMTKIGSDPIVGISGLSQYQTYSENLIDSVNGLVEEL